MPEHLIQRWGWFPAVLTLFIAGNTAYEFADDGAWVPMVMFGIVLPLGGIGEWLISRRGDSRVAADRMMTAFMVAMLAIMLLVEGETECPPAATQAAEPGVHNAVNPGGVAHNLHLIEARLSAGPLGEALAAAPRR